MKNSTESLVKKLNKCRDYLAGLDRDGCKRHSSCRDEQVISLANGEGLHRPPLASVKSLVLSLLNEDYYSFEKYSYLIHDQELLQSIVNYHLSQGVDNQYLTDVVVDTGTTSLFLSIFRHLLKSGSTVFIGEGFYHAFAAWADLARINLCCVPSIRANTYKLLAEDIENMMIKSESPDAVVIINPTYSGELYTAEELYDLLNLSRKYGFMLIEDAIFQGTEFKKASTPLFTTIHSRDRVLTVNGISKRLGLANIRIGWAIGSSALIATLKKKVNIETVAIPFIITKMAASAINDRSCFLENYRKECLNRVNLIKHEIETMNERLQRKAQSRNIVVIDVVPQAGQNIFIRFPYFDDLYQHSDFDSADFIRKIGDNSHVILSPCLSNGIEGIVCRIVFPGLGADHTYVTQKVIERRMINVLIEGKPFNHVQVEHELWESQKHSFEKGREVILEALSRLENGLEHLVRSYCYA